MINVARGAWRAQQRGAGIRCTPACLGGSGGGEAVLEASGVP